MTNSVMSLRGLLRYVTLFAGLGALFVAGTLLHPQFLTIANQRDVLAQVSINGILAVGMTLVILTAGIDLSVGSVMSLCTVVCAMLLMERPEAGAAGVRWASRAHYMLVPALAVFAWLAVYGIVRRVARWREWNALDGGIVLFGTLLVTAVALACLPTRWLWGDGFTTLAVLLVVPVVGGMLGLVNGVIIAQTRLQPFIVTLAMMVAAVGLAKFIAGNGGQIHAIYTGDTEHAGAPTSFEQLGATILTVGQETLRTGRVRDLKLVPIPGLFLIGAWLWAALVLRKLALGRYVFAVGGNEEAARLAGVPVAGVKIFAYTACGVLAGLAAVLYCAQYTQGKADAGQGKELDAIAAVVIGGTSLMGGRGSILGTLVGVMIFGYLTNILQLRAVSSEIQDILKGVIIVVAAVAQSGDLLGGLRHIWRRPARG
ncbi:MAG: ABC transporter permease [Phycisphaerae bacterium]|nr:ABC transporter permease [Phycisphaerae bacterium]